MKKYQIPTKKRNHFLDLTKAFAIFLVVYGHCIQFGSGDIYLEEGLFWKDIVFKYIYSFHMPLFMLISGYLFANGIDKDGKKIFINKFKSLVVPILLWAIIPLAMFISAHGTAIIPAIEYYFFYSIHTLWFLWAVFWCSMIVLVTNKAFKDNVFVYTLIFLVSFVIPDRYNLDLYKFMFPYFVIGYFYKRNGLQERFKKIYSSNYFIGIIGIVFIFMLCFFEVDIYIYISRHSILGEDVYGQLYIDIYRYVIGLIGSIFTLTLLMRIYNFYTKRRVLNENSFLLTIGKSTMGIYVISSFMVSCLLNEITGFMTYPNYLVIGIESILAILVSILLIKIIQHCRILNRLLLGAK